MYFLAVLSMPVLVALLPVLPVTAVLSMTVLVALLPVLPVAAVLSMTVLAGLPDETGWQLIQTACWARARDSA
jgi:hypothetical protein